MFNVLFIQPWLKSKVKCHVSTLSPVKAALLWKQLSHYQQLNLYSTALQPTSCWNMTFFTADIWIFHSKKSIDAINNIDDCSVTFTQSCTIPGSWFWKNDMGCCHNWLYIAFPALICNNVLFEEGLIQICDKYSGPHLCLCNNQRQGLALSYQC